MAPVRLVMNLARQVGIFTYLIVPLSFPLWLIITLRSIIVLSLSRTRPNLIVSSLSAPVIVKNLLFKSNSRILPLVHKLFNPL